jgi:hypothetical protein
MTMQNLQVEFETLVKYPNKPNTGESLKFVALALWYENFVPDVKTFKGVDAAQAGYLLDKLTRYNCLEHSQKDLLRSQLLSQLKQKKGNTSPTTNSRDMLVKEWGASVELKSEFRGLVNYQRRSYKSSHGVLAA